MSTAWPFLNEYSGPQLAQVRFPLGGIGTGSIALGGRANLCDFEICNRPDKGFTPPWTFFAIRVQQAGSPAITRLLEGELTPPYDGSHGVMIANKGVPRHPMLRSAGSGLPRLRHVKFRAAYPFAQYTLGDPDIPLDIRLEAFNPLIPLDPERSGLPIAVLRYVLTNPSDVPASVSLAGSLYNFMGRRHNPDQTASFRGGNRNHVRSERIGQHTIHGLLMTNDTVPDGDPERGTIALAVIASDASMRTNWGSMQWSGNLQTFWDDFSSDGHLDLPKDNTASASGEGQNGSVATSVQLAPRASTTITFLICWHFPNRTIRTSGWDIDIDEDEDVVIGNFYCNQYSDAWEVARSITPQLAALEAESSQFVQAFLDTSLPQAVKEAALNNLSTLRSQTCFRTADGHFFGFEGCWDDLGCCTGSCTHVWNYEQATPYLFPSLARDMRDLELTYGTVENGLNCFRLALPLGSTSKPRAAADGQMGIVMKCYREWKLSADQDFLVEHWPAIRSLLTFCWQAGGWDADGDGIMEGVQHNTSDIEFYGPNPLSQFWYLGALAAAAEMATAAGDPEFATRCRQLFTEGSRQTDDQLFNGEYYRQQIRVPAPNEPVAAGLTLGLGESDHEAPAFQVGNGCLADQLAGQYMAHVVGLGHLCNADHIRSALAAIYRHNFRPDLHTHWNNLRSFALADEKALLVCTWPYDDAPPHPFFRAYEVWTGVEYQVAAHMIYEGLVKEGLEITRAIRARFDGERRNPWNEQECGHHYARAMASWALVLSLNGFSYSAVDATIGLAPRLEPHAFSSIWTIPTGWGTVEQSINDNKQTISWRVLAGTLPLQSCVYRLSEGATVHSLNALHLDQPLSCSFEAREQQITVTFHRPVTLAPDQELTISIILN